MTDLLNPLTLNDYTIKDSYDVAARIRQIPQQLLDEGYVFVSFDVTSLFTNVPLDRTINVILNRIYKKGLIKTRLKKTTLKKLIKDTCTKTVFSCNDQLYEQINGVSMGSSMGPVLANIIMTELESVIITKLIDAGTIKFYGRYVDDTLLLVKPSDITKIHDLLNSFDPSIKFTVDKFDNEVPHFLDLEISPDGLSIFRKDTNTGQYTNFDSYENWNYKTAWIKSLVTRAKRICSDHKLNQELSTIRQFASWNSFPSSISNALIKRTLNKTNTEKENKQTDKNETVIWLRMPYFGDQSTQMVRSLEAKLRRCVRPDKKLIFKTTFSTTKINFFTNNKDKTPNAYKANVVYRFCCPGCSATYIGKTERNLHERCEEHATKKDSAIYNHIMACDDLLYLNRLMHLNIDDVSRKDKRSYFINLIENNTKIIDNANNWSILLSKEALYIKRQKPILNNGLKASRELFLFS